MSNVILKKFIREALNELRQQAVPPGKWAANTGEPASPEDLERLGGIVTLDSDLEEDEQDQNV